MGAAVIVAVPGRIDALPEGANYRDTGCSLHSACLSCPFEQCRFDGEGTRSLRAERTKQRVRDAWVRGLSINGIAAEAGISRRSVHRVLRELRG